MFPDLSRKTNQELCELFQDDKSVAHIYNANVIDAGEMYFAFGEIALEMSQRDFFEEYVRSHLDCWDPLRQASVLSELSDGDWAISFSKEKLKSEDERLRAVA